MTRKLLACIVTIILSSFPLLNNIEATTSREVFAKYPNKYFIETGSFFGDGIRNAYEAGFEYIYSIELSPYLYKLCVERFAGNPNIVLLQGDSAIVLPQILTLIDAPATFWLDGHFSEGVTAKGDTCTPILSELDSIAKHHIKTHTIMIDDVRLFGTGEFDFVDLNTVIEKILEINPDYQITYEDGWISKDVLVAYIPQI